MIKLIAFDLDGTLTQHRTCLGEENRAVLDALGKKYSLLMVGAGGCKRIFSQMLEYPIDIIGNYGLQYAEYKDGELMICRDSALPAERESVISRVEDLRAVFGFTDYRGDSVEFHPSGSLTFPILGTAANLDDKLSFDPDKSKRRKIYRAVADAFSEYNVFIGGSSSFDIVPKPYDKLYALINYCGERGIKHSEVLFVGDDYGIGGNDEPVYKSDFGFRKIDDYTKLRDVMSDLI